MEEWRPIKGEPGYEVSSFGRVRSWKPLRNFAPAPSEPRVLKSGTDKDGYQRVCLYQHGVSRNEFRVCALVYEAWHGPRPSGAVVRHLDGVNTNDHRDNLAWGTPKQNSMDSQKHGTWVHGPRVNTAKLTEADVREILASDLGHSELARRYGVTPGAIWHIRDNRTWKHVER